VDYSSAEIASYEENKDMFLQRDDVFLQRVKMNSPKSK